MFMISTDKATRFSSDRVVNSFVIAASYIASRLLAGGTLVTGISKSTYVSAKPESSADVYWDANAKPPAAVSRGNFCAYDNEYLYSFAFSRTGPVLNPGLGLGQMASSGDFTYVLQYFVAPVGGAILALVFFEFVFVKSQQVIEHDEFQDDHTDLQSEDIHSQIDE